MIIARLGLADAASYECCRAHKRVIRAGRARAGLRAGRRVARSSHHRGASSQLRAIPRASTVNQGRRRCGEEQICPGDEICPHAKKPLVALTARN